MLQLETVEPAVLYKTIQYMSLHKMNCLTYYSYQIPRTQLSNVIFRIIYVREQGG